MAYTQRTDSVCMHAQVHTYMHACTHAHTHIHTHTHTHTHTYTHIHTHTYTHTYTYIHTYIHTHKPHIHTYTHTYTHTHTVHTQTHIHIQTHTHTHTHIHTHTQTPLLGHPTGSTHTAVMMSLVVQLAQEHYDKLNTLEHTNYSGHKTMSPLVTIAMVGSKKVNIPQSCLLQMNSYNPLHFLWT